MNNIESHFLPTVWEFITKDTENGRQIF